MESQHLQDLGDSLSTQFATDRRASPILGIWSHLPGWEIDKRAWITARNVRAVNGRLQMVRGVRQFAGVQPRCFQSGLLTHRQNHAVLGGIDPFLSDATDAGDEISLIGLARFFDGTQQGVVGTTRNLFRLDDTGSLVALNAAAFTGSVGTRWEMAQLLDQVYFCNPFDPVQVWDGGVSAVAPLIATASSITAGPWSANNTGVPRAYTMTEFQNHLILGRIVTGAGQDPQSIAGSGLQDTTDWNLVDLTHEARSALVPEDNSPVVAVRKLGDFLVVYKNFSIHIFYYTGGQLVYQRQMVSSKTGTPSGASVVSVCTENGANDQHYFIGQNNIYMFDGSAHPIGDRVWREFVKKVLPSSRTKIVGAWNEKQKEVYWVFAAVDGTGDMDTALVYDLENDAFFYRDFPYTAFGLMTASARNDSWDSQHQSWDVTSRSWDVPASLIDLENYVGNKAGILFEFEPEADSVDFDGIAVLESGLDDGGDDSRLKIENGMRVDVPALWGTNPLEVYVRGLYELNDAVPYSLAARITSEGANRVNYHVTGRWIQRMFRKDGGYFELGSYSPSQRFRGQN